MPETVEDYVSFKSFAAEHNITGRRLEQLRATNRVPEYAYVLKGEEDVKDIFFSCEASKGWNPPKDTGKRMNYFSHRDRTGTREKMAKATLNMTAEKEFVDELSAVAERLGVTPGSLLRTAAKDYLGWLAFAEDEDADEMVSDDSSGGAVSAPSQEEEEEVAVEETPPTMRMEMGIALEEDDEAGNSDDDADDEEEEVEEEADEDTSEGVVEEDDEWDEEDSGGSDEADDVGEGVEEDAGESVDDAVGLDDDEWDENDEWDEDDED